MLLTGEAISLIPIGAEALHLVELGGVRDRGRQILRSESADSDGHVALVPGLVFQIYVRYYQHPRVLTGLGLEPRPPYPKGYEMEPADPSLLERVRRKPPLYREC